MSKVAKENGQELPLDQNSLMHDYANGSEFHPAASNVKQFGRLRTLLPLLRNLLFIILAGF